MFFGTLTAYSRKWDKIESSSQQMANTKLNVVFRNTISTLTYGVSERSKVMTLNFRRWITRKGARVGSCSDVFSELICTLANLSFAEGCFLAIFKQAIVNPLIKKRVLTSLSLQTFVQFLISIIFPNCLNDCSSLVFNHTFPTQQISTRYSLPTASSTPRKHHFWTLLIRSIPPLTLANPQYSCH